MGNYGCAFSQSEAGKYFELIIITNHLYFCRTGHPNLTVLKRCSISGPSMCALMVCGLLFQRQ